MNTSCFKYLCILLFSLGATGCAWFFSDPQLNAIKLASSPPDPAQCRFIAQAVSTGSTVTSDPDDLLEQRQEAEENIKRIALQRGGNVVYVAETLTANIDEFLDSAETTIVGHIYHCR